MKKDSNTSAIERVQKELSDYIANRNKEKADIDAEKAKIEELKKQEAECFDEDAFLKIRADIRTSEDKLAFLQKLASQPKIDESKIADNSVESLGVFLCLSYAAVDYYLVKLRYLHRALVLEFLHKSGSNLGCVHIFHSCH